MGCFFRTRTGVSSGQTPFGTTGTEEGSGLRTSWSPAAPATTLFPTTIVRECNHLLKVSCPTLPSRQHATTFRAAHLRGAAGVPELDHRDLASEPRLIPEAA